MSDPRQLGEMSELDGTSVGPGSATGGALIAGVVVLLAGALLSTCVAAVATRWMARDEGGPASVALAAPTPTSLMAPLPVAATPTSRYGTIVVPSGSTTGIVRASPSKSAPILTQLRPGDRIEIIGDQLAPGPNGPRTWYKIRSGGLEGWMHQDIVRTDP